MVSHVNDDVMSRVLFFATLSLENTFWACEQTTAFSVDNCVIIVRTATAQVSSFHTSGSQPHHLISHERYDRWNDQDNELNLKMTPQLKTLAQKGNDWYIANSPKPVRRVTRTSSPRKIAFICCGLNSHRPILHVLAPAFRALDNLERVQHRSARSCRMFSPQPRQTIQRLD